MRSGVQSLLQHCYTLLARNTQAGLGVSPGAEDVVVLEDSFPQTHANVEKHWDVLFSLFCAAFLLGKRISSETFKPPLNEVIWQIGCVKQNTIGQVDVGFERQS